MPDFSVCEHDLTHCPEVNAMVQQQKDQRESKLRDSANESYEIAKDVGRYMVNQAKDRIRTTSNYEPPPEKLFRNMTREQRIAQGWVEQADGSWVKH